MRCRFVGIFCWALAALVGPFSSTQGASPASSARAASAAIDLFAAQATGQIEVQPILQDSTAGTVVIANKTGAPLSIRLPDAFAGVPVLAQRGRGVGGGAGNLGATGGANQRIGGAFGGGGGLGGGGIGGGGGVFSIAPERASKLKFAAVCLDHGKPDPNPRVAYKLVPIDAATSDDRVIEVVKMLGRDDIDQPEAQAAAWHFASGLGWQQLADKIGVKHLSGATVPYFSSAQLERARHIASQVAKGAAESGRLSPSREESYSSRE